MARKKMFYFKVAYDMPEDERIQDLVDAWGVEGWGVWFACLFQLYRHGNETQGPLETDKMVRRVSKFLEMDVDRVAEICSWMADEGLFNKEMWERGFSTNEHASEAINTYWARVENGKKGGRPPSKPQVKT